MNRNWRRCVLVDAALLQAAAPEHTDSPPIR